MVFSFVNNTSIGSRCFMDFGGGHSWGSPTSVTGNRIIEPTGEFAIRLGNGGPYLVADNVIRSRPGKTTPEVHLTWGDQALIGNTYTIANAVKTAGRFRILDEKVVDAKTISAAAPKLPPTPPNRKRKIFDVPAGADAAAIQAAIDQAAKLSGQRPVVHLPMGVYKIDRTLVIPAGCDVQLIGDGAAETATVLRWTGKPGGVLLKLAGPSHATVRDLGLYPGRATGLRIEDCDQPGGRVFADQLNVSGGSPSRKARVGLLVAGVEQSDVLLRDLQGGSFIRKWIQVVGGPARRAGKTAPGQVSIFCGATGSADHQYTVEKGGRLVVRSVYHEMSGAEPQGMLLKDAGVLSIDATRFSYKTSATRPLIALDGFRGDLTLLTGLLLPVASKHTARVQIAGDGSASRVLCMGNLFWVNEMGVDADKVWQDRAAPPAKAAMLLCNMNSGLKGAVGRSGFGRLDSRGVADDAFLRQMLAPLRQARVWLPPAAKKGVTNVRLRRVIIGVGPDGIGAELRARP